MIRDAGGAERGRKPPPWGAIFASTALHLGFALSIFTSASGVISGGMPAAQYGDAVEVTLSGMEGAPAPSAIPAQQSELESLFQHIRATQSDLTAQDKPTDQHGDLAILFNEIDHEHARTAGNGTGQSQTNAAGHKGSGSDSAGDEAQGGNAQAAARNGERSQDTSSGGLWGQIEPCWRRMPESSTVPVTLELTLTGRGALAVPPRILRPMAAALTDQRLVAEARAVAACAPLQTPLSGSQRTFRVVFMPTSDRSRKR